MRDRAQIRADLAQCDRDGTPWPSAARRLLADLPEILDRLDELDPPAKPPEPALFEDVPIPFDELDLAAEFPMREGQARPAHPKHPMGGCTPSGYCPHP